MGLDTVEMVLAFEEAFGIHIPDGALKKLQSPGDVFGPVIGLLKVKSEKPGPLLAPEPSERL